MDSNTEKIAYGSNLTVFAFNGNGKIPVLYGGYTIVTELSEDLVSENNYNLITEEEITSINIKITNADSTSERTYTFPFEEGQILSGNDYIDSEGLHIGNNIIAFTTEQEEAYQALQNLTLYEGITHIIVTDAVPAVLKLSYNSVEEDNQIYVLNKNEQLLAIFNKDDDETLINPRIEKRQNSESVFTFTIDAKNPKWNEINNPENLYVVDGMMFSTNFDGSFKENISENDEKTIEVTAYERQQLLSRKFVRAWNSETNLEKIDTFMVVILSNGNLPLKNNGVEITTRYPKGSSGYVLEGLLYGTGWTVGTCDIYEYENGQVVKDENNNPVYSKFDLETDQVNIYDNILKVQELWGGILVFDSLNKIVHHRDETLYLPYNGYEVRYQKNMQSLEKEYNNKIITKLCPLGEGGLNIVGVNDGSVWLENYSYTDTVLEGIENNPDITDQAQLKRWGERKLEMLCRPTIELDVNLALMYQLEGYELETIDLNDIVDVINYNDVDTDYIQLRVVEFSYSVWNKSDASVKLSNITLDSTDIFRKAVTATNIINTGTLEASKVINIYKGGQSVEQTMIVLDGKTEFTYSELTRTDTGIIARVTHTENEYNTLSGTVGRHTEEIGEWDITSGSITSVVAAKVGDNEIISKINQTPETITINANKVGISANDVLNILAGNTINLTSKNISILSDNFSVDSSGTVTMSKANVTGGKIYIDARWDYSGEPAITVDQSFLQQKIEIYGGSIIARAGADPTNSSYIEITGNYIKRNGQDYFLATKGLTTWDLDQLTDTGHYYIGNTAVGNAPNGFGTWYGVCVIRAFSSGGYTFQIAYKPSVGKIAIREYSGNPGSWTPWRTFSSPSTTHYSNWHSIVLTRSDDSWINIMLYGSNNLREGEYSIDSDFKMYCIRSSGNQELTIPKSAVESISRHDWGFELNVNRDKISGDSGGYNGIAIISGGDLTLRSS